MSPVSGNYMGKHHLNAPVVYLVARGGLEWIRCHCQ